jgi:hypothetical protein
MIPSIVLDKICYYIERDLYKLYPYGHIHYDKKIVPIWWEYIKFIEDILQKYPMTHISITFINGSPIVSYGYNMLRCTSRYYT